MFTNGVVASVKIYRGDGDGASPFQTALPACVPAAASDGGAADEPGSGGTWGPDGNDPGSGETWSLDGGVAAGGQAPQEGFET